MRAIHYHPSHFISLPVSAAILVFSDESRCELRLKLPQHGSGQDPRTPITLGDPSAAPRGGLRDFVPPPGVWQHHHQARGFRGLTSELSLSAGTSGAGSEAPFWGALSPG